MLEPSKAKRYSFAKKEHLVGKKNISTLFVQGNKIVVAPFVVIYRYNEEQSGVRVLVSIPKRIVKYATDRNRYKRLLRENYRQQKHQLTDTIEHLPFGLDIAITLTPHKEKITFASTKHNMVEIIAKLTKRILDETT